MKFIWIIFLIIAVQDIICNKIAKNKKELIIYGSIVLLSVVLCISYYSDEYSNSLLGMLNNKINLERFVWIK